MSDESPRSLFDLDRFNMNVNMDMNIDMNIEMDMNMNAHYENKGHPYIHEHENEHERIHNECECYIADREDNHNYNHNHTQRRSVGGENKQNIKSVEGDQNIKGFTIDVDNDAKKEIKKKTNENTEIDPNPPQSK
jgi:hypothetical protein